MNVRALPIGLPPVSRETLGSYLHRLADANHITIAAVTQLLGINRRYRRGDDDPTNWTAGTVNTLAALTARPITTLTWALPALHPLTTVSTAGTASATPASTGIACRCCMASKGIHGLVIQRTASHEHVCLRHQRWLRGPEQHSLHSLPELCSANRRHRRLLQRHEPTTLENALTRAQQLVRDGFHTARYPTLRNRWTHRLNSLHRDPHADPYRPSQHRVDLAVYPEMIILAELLNSDLARNPDVLHEAALDLNRLGAVHDLLDQAVDQ